jgi:hypothetical protein
LTLAKLKKRVAYWNKRLEPLGITHWRITVEIHDDPFDDMPSATARTSTSHKYDSAWIQFQRSFLDEVEETSDWQELDEVIIHELLHVAFRDLTNVHHLLDNQLSTADCEHFHHALTMAEEKVVERLARAIYYAALG